MYCTHKSSIFCRLLSIFIFGVMVLAGCNTEPEIDNDFLDDIGDIEAVYFEPIGQGSQSSFDQRMETVVKDSVAWASYLDKMKTVIPIRDVDFSQLMVAFAAIPSPHAGITVQFESAERIEGELVLSYLLGVPGQDCRIIDTPSAPFQAIVIRKIDLPVKFEYRQETQHCVLD